MDFCEKGNVKDLYIHLTVLDLSCIQSIHVFHMLLLYFTLGDLYSKINSQRGILFAEEQVCTQKQEFWIMLLLKWVYFICMYKIMFKSNFVMVINQKLSILLVPGALLDCWYETPLKLLPTMFDRKYTLYPVVFSTDQCCDFVCRWWTGLFRSA